MHTIQKHEKIAKAKKHIDGDKMSERRNFLPPAFSMDL
jgi:hypothetical protein